MRSMRGQSSSQLQRLYGLQGFAKECLPNITEKSDNLNHNHELNLQIHKSDMSNQEDHMFQSQELIASNQIPTKTDRKHSEKQHLQVRNNL